MSFDHQNLVITKFYLRRHMLTNKNHLNTMGIHTIWQTYFPVNVQVPLTCITLKYHIQKWVSLTGLCSQKNIVFPDFLLQTTVSSSQLNSDKDKIEFKFLVQS